MTFLLIPQTRQKIIEFFVSEYPKEACGYIIDGDFFPCRNDHEEPLLHFRMLPDDVAMAYDKGEVQAVVHSHPNAPATPSWADRKSCYESAIPWGIFSIGPEGFHAEEWLRPEKFIAPLVGRPFIHGVFDCCTILLDFYEREMGRAFENPNRDVEWWNKGQNLYLENLPSYGFKEVFGAPQHGDIILMQIKSPVPNHAAIFLADGDLNSEKVDYPVKNSILHHMQNQNSRRDIYGGMWAEKTVGIWRLKN